LLLSACAHEGSAGKEAAITDQKTTTVMASSFAVSTPSKNPCARNVNSAIDHLEYLMAQRAQE
jgi:hypothetical protein